MKLPETWKASYLRSLQTPVIGKWMLGPLLRSIWRAIQYFSKKSVPPVSDDGRITTYASTIDSLRRKLATMEQKINLLESEMTTHRESKNSWAMLLSCAVEGLAQRASRQHDAFDFQQQMTTAALSALKDRSCGLAPNQCKRLNYTEH